MINAKLRVLKAMSEATGHVTFNEFADMVGLTASETLETFHELTETGHVKKVNSGYALTENGKTALKAIVPVAHGSEFEFYVDIGKPQGSSASSPLEFYGIMKEIEMASVEFHLFRKDFENWVRDSLDNAALVDELADLQESGLTGEALRSAIISAFESVYCLP